MHLGGNRRWVPLITLVFSFYHLSRETYAKHQRWSKSVCFNLRSKALNSPTLPNLWLVHFRLTCVAQKRLCLSSLVLSNLVANISWHAGSLPYKCQRAEGRKENESGVGESIPSHSPFVRLLRFVTKTIKTGPERNKM